MYDKSEIKMWSTQSQCLQCVRSAPFSIPSVSVGYMTVHSPGMLLSHTENLEQPTAMRREVRRDRYQDVINTISAFAVRPLYPLLNSVWEHRVRGNT
jgi:hypothetical protein